MMKNGRRFLGGRKIKKKTIFQNKRNDRGTAIIRRRRQQKPSASDVLLLSPSSPSAVGTIAARESVMNDVRAPRKTARRHWSECREGRDRGENRRIRR